MESYKSYIYIYTYIYDIHIHMETYLIPIEPLGAATVPVEVLEGHHYGIHLYWLENNKKPQSIF